MEQNSPKISILQKLLGKSAPAVNGATPAPIAPKPVQNAPAMSPVVTPSVAAVPAISLPAPTPPAENQSGNAFTKLFGTPAVTQPNSAPSKSVLPSIASLLGPKPTFSRHEFEEEERKTTKIAKVLFQVFIVLAVVTYGFFYTQLESSFSLFSSQLGPNAATRFESSNVELKKTQTENNLVRFRLIRLMLDGINAQIDSRTAQINIIDSPNSTEVVKTQAKTALEKINQDIKKNLLEVQALMVQSFGVDIFSKVPISEAERELSFTALLVEQLQKERALLSGENSTVRDELRSIDNVINLVENAGFRGIMRSKDFGKISDDDLSLVLQQIREQGTDRLSAIEKIRKQRLNWAKIISDINGVTRKADLYYGQGLFKTVGGFLFSSYRFDAKSKRIAITGITKTSDSKTFSFIARLIDSIEKSPQFMNIDFRTFSKTLSEDGDYSSSINLDFELQGGPDSRDDISIANTPK